MKRRIPTEEEAQEVVKKYPTVKAYVDATVVPTEDPIRPSFSQPWYDLVQEAKQYYSYCKFMVDGPNPSD